MRDLAAIISVMHDSEINGEIAWFYDGVWAVKIGDPLNGYVAEDTVAGPEAAAEWFRDICRAPVSQKRVRPALSGLPAVADGGTGPGIGAPKTGRGHTHIPRPVSDGKPTSTGGGVTVKGNPARLPRVPGWDGRRCGGRYQCGGNMAVEISDGAFRVREDQPPVRWALPGAQDAVNILHGSPQIEPADVARRFSADGTGMRATERRR